MVKLLLKKEGIQVNLGDKDGRSPLIIGAEKGHQEVVKVLLEKEVGMREVNESDARNE